MRDLLRAVPFHPFTIHLADGRRHEVPHPDFLSISPKGTEIIVYDADDNAHYLSPLLIVEASPKRKRAKKSR